MTAETSSSYSRENITNSENREKAVQEMRAEKGHVKADQAKTPEQKRELSEKWLKRAGMTDGGGKAEIMKLLGDPKSAADFVAAVEKKQKEYGLKDDGILGWATLEKMDNEITQGQDEYYVNKPDESGLERSEARAAKVAADKPTESQIADIERAAGYSGAVGDTIDPAGYNLDPAYNYTVAEGNTIQRTKDGQTEVWDKTGKKWAKEGESSAPSDKPTESQIADIERAAGYGAAGDSIDPSGYNLDPSYAYEKTEDSIQRTKDGQTEVWDTTGKKWENTEARDIRLAQEEEKNEYDSYQKNVALITDEALKTVDETLINEKIGDMTIGRINEIKEDNTLSVEQRKALQELSSKTQGLDSDMKISDFIKYSRNPVLAAERYAPTDKPGKLPGKLGEYGATYQQGNLRKPDGSTRENTFVYKEGKVPQVIVNGEAKNINQVYTAPGVYKLPNGDLYRVSMNNEGVAKMAKVEKEDGSGTVANVDSNGNLNKVS